MPTPVQERISLQRDPLHFAHANGWTVAASRVAPSLSQRVRDHFLARTLRAPGFRTGRGPRLLGLRHITLGADFHAGDALWLEAVLRYGDKSFQPELHIGPHARLSDRVHIACLARITVGSHLLCGSGVLISDHTHGRFDASPEASDPGTPPAERALYAPAPVTIGENVWLGDGVAVLAGAVIGDGCVVGANAVVTGTLPPRTLAVGVPARVSRRWAGAQHGWVPTRPDPAPPPLSGSPQGAS